MQPSQKLVNSEALELKWPKMLQIMVRPQLDGSLGPTPVKGHLVRKNRAFPTQPSQKLVNSEALELKWPKVPQIAAPTQLDGSSGPSSMRGQAVRKQPSFSHPA